MLLFIAGRASYLSPTVCDEFIEIMGRKVFNTISEELRIAKYYAISVDSTPDTSHVDQLAFCIRYVKNEAPLERFLRFIPIREHKSEYLCNIVLTFLETYGIDIMDCRGQSYDNAYNVAGAYSGLQKRIIEVNNLASFFPCAAHSLALAGKNAAAKNTKAADFFNFLENLYLFFVRSPARWEKLQAILSSTELVLKRSTGTRWSAKYSAVKALCSSYPKVIQILVAFLSADSGLTEEHKSTARSLLKKLCKFQTIFMLFLWEKILIKIEKVNQSLQKAGLDLAVTVKLFASLLGYLEDLKTEFNSVFDASKRYFTEYVKSNDELRDHLQSRTRSEVNDSVDAESMRDASQNRIFVPIIDFLLAELRERSQAYTDLYEKFDFLVKLKSMSNDQISDACQKVATIYKSDICGDELANECEMAKFYFNDSDDVSHSYMYSTIIRDKLSTTFPNIEILLRIYLALFVSNATDERAFSKLKIIKSYLRNSMTDERLNNLSLLCIERNVLDTIDFEKVIDEFLSSKSRRFMENSKA